MIVGVQFGLYTSLLFFDQLPQIPVVQPDTIRKLLDIRSTKDCGQVVVGTHDLDPRTTQLQYVGGENRKRRSSEKE